MSLPSLPQLKVQRTILKTRITKNLNKARNNEDPAVARECVEAVWVSMDQIKNTESIF